MRKEATVFLAFVLVVGLCGGAGAQVFMENHYLVYQLNNEFTADVTVTLQDQFDQYFHPEGYTTNYLVMDKFANPVMKNGEDWYEPFIHQTWWRIDDPQDVKEVRFVNQIGDQTWDVFDGLYLVLPAFKDQPPGSGFPTWNHYKCYDATGDNVFFPVNLQDQWGTYDSVAAFPVMFCNPCIKDVFGFERFEIVDDFPHLAVYQLEQPILGDHQAFVADQFGERNITTERAIWLVVPSDKLSVVGSEMKSWGSIKSLYR